MAAYAPILPMVRELRDGGATLAAVAEKLNAEGHSTAAGRPFTATAIFRLLNR